MCTCITYQNGDFYFGRNLDLEYSFGEQVVVTPRNYPFSYRMVQGAEHPYAMVGMATVMDNYPLYAEAANEKGLCMAGLNFPGNACYQEVKEGAYNVTPFELIPWLLGQCASLEEAEKLLRNTCLVKIPFRENVPLAPLHWMIADEKRCLTVEAVQEGLRIYENPFGVLTNNPPFPYHEMNLQNYMNLTPEYPENRFARELSLRPYGQGMGALGLPGDASPASRFVKTVFLIWNSVSEQPESATLSQFFHILDQVSMVRGMIRTPEQNYDITTYSCCINATKGMYYFKTYENNRIQAVNLYGEDLEGSTLYCYELGGEQEIGYRN